jgi:3-hydroxyisobutyrate dehydrogenase-like beta-hydroxyacid dehydrogenase
MKRNKPTAFSFMLIIHSSMTTGHIGFIGLGIMGYEMANRLVSEGIAGTSSSNALYIWNRSKDKCSSLQDRFKDKVIIVCDSPKEVIQHCLIAFSMLSTPEASREVFFAEDGVLAGVSEGKAIVDCATLAETDMQQMNECVIGKGGYVLQFSFLFFSQFSIHFSCTNV